MSTLATNPAHVVSDALGYSMGRMIGSMVEFEIPAERGLFDSLGEALEWLSLGQVAELPAAHGAAEVVAYPGG